jgi:calcium channel MID1
MIPRCTDFTSTDPWLQRRAMGQPFPNGTFLDQNDVSAANLSQALNGSRNPFIDGTISSTVVPIVPGPYKEILPCEDLCYNIVQSCPASMGLNCPRPGVLGFAESYGIISQKGGDENGRITNYTCNYPGVVYYLAAGGRITPSMVLLLTSVVLGVLMG